MRYQVNQNLFAVHFGYNDRGRAYGFFCQPLAFDTIVPDTINFTHLTVSEHHKVRDAHHADGELVYDGYLLKDNLGKEFANQYPTAAYQQLSDEGNQRFRRHQYLSDEVKAERAENPKTIIEYHLLSDVLENIQRGIKDLGEVKLTDANKEAVRRKRDLLITLYDRIVVEFHAEYPDYQLIMTWEPPFKKSTLLWPVVTFRKRISLEKARAMDVKQILADFLSDGALEVKMPHSDRLVIERASGSYYLEGDARNVDTINVFYLENTGDTQNDKLCFFVCQTEYFPSSWDQLAVECFHKRLHSETPARAVSMGMSVEAIYAKQKVDQNIPDETIGVVRSSEVAQ